MKLYAEQCHQPRDSKEFRVIVCIKESVSVAHLTAQQMYHMRLQKGSGRKTAGCSQLKESVWFLPEQDEADGLHSCPSDIIVDVTHLN